MKIKVTFEQEFDSRDWFDYDYNFTEREFKNLIFEHILDFMDDDWKVEITEENDNK